MSYILDALKKAAEQRSGPPVEVRRLLSPAPVPAPSPMRSLTIAAVGGGVMIAIAAALWLWIPAHEAPAPTTQPVASVTSVAAVPTPGTSPPATLPDERPRVTIDKKARMTPVPIESTSEPPRTTGSDARSTATKSRAAEPKPPRASPPAPIVPAPAPPAVAVLPPTTPPPAPRPEVSKLRVEVIVYSEERPLRWAFISGRRYVEGDAIGNGARVEEIQSNGVVLVEDGRRITLRP